MLVCVCVFRFYFDLIVHCKLYIYLLLTCDEFNSILSGFIIKYMYVYVCVYLLHLPIRRYCCCCASDKQNCVNGLPIERSLR